MGASILDLTGQNPLTRLPSSEFHSLTGLREWLRVHCANEFGDIRGMAAKLKLRHSASLHAPQVGHISQQQQQPHHLHQQQQQQQQEYLQQQREQHQQVIQTIDDLSVTIRQCCIS